MPKIASVTPTKMQKKAQNKFCRTIPMVFFARSKICGILFRSLSIRTTEAARIAMFVPLPMAMLSDGPWCGSGAARFDADLLRVRKVRVTLRVEATQAAFRAAGAAFAHPGAATRALSALPDVGLTFDVSPRNLNLKR